MDRRLHAVQDRLAEHCAQTFKTVQGSVSAVTSVSFKQKDLQRKVSFFFYYNEKLPFVIKEREGIYLHNGNVLTFSSYYSRAKKKVIERYMYTIFATLLSVNKYTFYFIRLL